MAKILKLSDRIPVTIEDVTLKLAPLCYQHKMEIQQYMIEAATGNMQSAMKGAALAIKYSVKDITGVEDYSGNKFELSFEENGSLSEECVDNLLNLSLNNKMIAVCASLLNGLPEEEMKHPVTGEKMEGITFGKVEGN